MYAYPMAKRRKAADDIDGFVHDIQMDLLRRYREQARHWREREAEDATHALKYEKAAEGIEALIGSEAERPKPSETLRGGDAVLAVMREKDQIWTARQVHEELERRGWISADVAHPLRGTEAAINRLWKAGKVERLGRGRYRFKK
jgi:hypothetical protein